MILSIIPQRLNHKAGLDCFVAIQQVASGLAKFGSDRSQAQNNKMLILKMFWLTPTTKSPSPISFNKASGQTIDSTQ